MQKIIYWLSRLFFSITTKIMVTCILIIFVVVTIVNRTAFDKIKSQVTADKEKDLVRISQHQEQLLSHEFEVTQRTVRSVATDRQIIDFLENQNPGNYATSLALLQSYNSSQRYESLYILDKSGMTVAATNQTFLGNDYSFRDYFTQARSDKVYITTALGITTNAMGYYFSYPIYSQTDASKFLGVAVIKMGEEQIHQMFFKNSGWETHLLDSEGVFIFSSNDSLILKSLIVIPELNELVGKKESQYLGKEIVSLGRENEWNRIRLSVEDTQFYANDFSKYGSKSFFVSRRIGSSDYHLLISSTQNEIFDSAFTLARDIVIQIVVASFVAVLFILFSVYTILLPIHKLKAFAETIALGDYQGELELKTHDEFQEMAATLSHMKQKVAKDFAELSQSAEQNQKISEKKVEELERLNNLMVNREIELIKLKKKLQEKEVTQ